MLGVGTRMQPHQQLWGTDSDLKMIRINLSAEEMDRINKPVICIVSDAATVLTALANALPKYNAKRASRKDGLDEARAQTMEMLTPLAPLAPQLAYIDAIRNALPEDDVFIDELTHVSYISHLAMPVYNPRSFIASGYHGTLGWEYATGLGAKVARPNTPVLSINGDGGFIFNVQELATAVRHNIYLVVVVFNDRAYGNVQRIQKLSYGNRTIASDLTNPNF